MMTKMPTQYSATTRVFDHNVRFGSKADAVRLRKEWVEREVGER